MLLLLWVFLVWVMAKVVALVAVVITMLKSTEINKMIEAVAMVGVAEVVV